LFEALMLMLETIRNAWSWTGLNPAEIVYINLFGNLIVKDVNGVFWRICPEELTCQKIATDFNKFAELWHEKNFRLNWEMARIVEIAEKKLGSLQKDDCYCFKLSPVVGGNYDAENLAKISLKELIAFSGDFAQQIKDIPDGGQIEIKFVK
jgi:hypothetical protein